MPGPIVMSGYLNKPDQTAETLRGGRLHTVDVARTDADGYCAGTEEVPPLGGGMPSPRLSA